MKNRRESDAGVSLLDNQIWIDKSDKQQRELQIVEEHARTTSFPITERQNLQFRTELFNTGSNWHQNQNNLIPGTSLGSCNFGAIASIGPCNPGISAGALLWTPRVLQFSLIYSF
jgi:hypothetical protein